MNPANQERELQSLFDILTENPELYDKMRMSNTKMPTRVVTRKMWEAIYNIDRVGHEELLKKRPTIYWARLLASANFNSWGREIEMEYSNVDLGVEISKFETLGEWIDTKEQGPLK